MPQPNWEEEFDRTYCDNKTPGIDNSPRMRNVETRYVKNFITILLREREQAIRAEYERKIEEARKEGFSEGKLYEFKFIEEVRQQARAEALKECVEKIEGLRAQGHDWNADNPKESHLIIREEAIEALQSLHP